MLIGPETQKTERVLVEVASILATTLCLGLAKNNTTYPFQWQRLNTWRLVVDAHNSFG